MEGIRLTIAMIVAVVLQWTLRNIAEPLAFIDFPLIVVVYAALQRNSIRAILFGTFAGLAVDALSGGLLGANGFSKTLIAYMVSEMARRVYLDNLILRIPIIAGACFLDDLIYLGMHRLFGQNPSADPLITVAYSLIGTTIVGTLVYLLMQNLAGERPRSRKRDMFAPRRQTRRRNPIRLNK
ncbi:MAG: rod shape-determining protein MreD [Pyrinomonadaceae bacterium]